MQCLKEPKLQIKGTICKCMPTLKLKLRPLPIAIFQKLKSEVQRDNRRRTDEDMQKRLECNATAQKKIKKSNPIRFES